jgi:hypothetical protein
MYLSRVLIFSRFSPVAGPCFVKARSTLVRSSHRPATKAGTSDHQHRAHSQSQLRTSPFGKGRESSSKHTQGPAPSGRMLVGCQATDRGDNGVNSPSNIPSLTPRSIPERMQAAPEIALTPVLLEQRCQQKAGMRTFVARSLISMGTRRGHHLIGLPCSLRQAGHGNTAGWRAQKVATHRPRPLPRSALSRFPCQQGISRITTVP